MSVESTQGSSKVRLGHALLWGIMTVGCDHPRVERILPSPDLAPVEVLTTIRGDSLRVSGLASSDGCDIWAIGGSWGTVLEIDMDSGESRMVGQLSGWIRNAHLEPGAGTQLLVWSQNTPTLGWLDTQSETFFPLERIPQHPWLPNAVGPAVVSAAGEIVVAPIGGRAILRSPRPWRDAELVWVLDRRGKVVRGLGQIRDAGGAFLSAAASRVTVGRAGDSLLVFHMSDATLDVYATNHAEGLDALGPIVHRLPQHLRTPKPWEEVWDPDWLVDSALPLIQHLDQVSEAAFSPDGRLFAVRNDSAVWSASENPMAGQLFRNPGTWEVTGQWLAVYNASAELLGAYSLPHFPVTGIVADGLGRLFLWRGDGTLSVVRDPTQSGPCAVPTHPITITHSDSPYGPLMKTSELPHPHGPQ